MSLVKLKTIPSRLKFFDHYMFPIRKITDSSQLHSTFRHIKEVIDKNVMKDLDNGMLQKQAGRIYDTKPFKLLLKKGKRYSWCFCGYSKSQPLCDGTHKIETLEIKIKPIQFEVPETKEYWLCNCKETKHRPFCDGTHLTVIKIKEANMNQQSN